MADSFSLQKYHTLVRLNPNDPEAHFGLAVALEEKGDITEASKEYDSAIRLSESHHSRAFLNKGFLYARVDDRPNAIRDWQNAWTVDPNIGNVMKDPANAQFYSVRIQHALEQFTRPVAMNENDGYAHYHLGMAYKFFDKPELALQSLKRAMDINPRLWEAYAAAGQIYAALGQNNYAISHFCKAADVNPKNGEAHYHLGLIYERENMIAKAVHHLERALELDSDNALIHFALGNTYMKSQQPMKAIKTYQKAADLDSRNPQIHFAMARALVGIYRPDFAMQEYERAIELDPRYAEALYHLGILCLQVGDVPRAIENLERCLKISPADPYAHYNLAEAYRRQDNYQKAIPHYYSAIELNPKDAFAHYNLALAYSRTDQFEQAIPQYQRAIELAPREGHFHYELARAYQKMRRPDMAIAEFESALQINPNDTDSMGEQATCYLETGQIDRCIDLYQRVIQLDAGSAEAHYRLGQAFLKLDEVDYAFEQFQNAVKLDNEHACSLCELGKIYLNHRNKADVGADFLRQALQIDPSYIEPRILLAELYLRTGRPDEARDQLDAVRHGAADDAALRARKARLLLEMGRTEDAIADFNAAIASDGENADTRIALAEVYHKLNYLQRAAEQYRAVVTLRPHDVGSLLTLARICVDSNRADEAKGYLERVVAIEPANEAALKELDLLVGPAEQAAPAADTAVNLPPAHAPAGARPVSPTAGSGFGGAAAAIPLENPITAAAAPPPSNAVAAVGGSASSEGAAGPPAPISTEVLEAKFRRAMLVHALGKTEEALQLFHQIVEVSPDFYKVYLYLGKSSQSKGEPFTARYLFEQGRDLAKAAGDEEFAAMFAEVLSALGGDVATTSAAVPSAQPTATALPSPQAPAEVEEATGTQDTIGNDQPPEDVIHAHAPAVEPGDDVPTDGVEAGEAVSETFPAGEVEPALEAAGTMEAVAFEYLAVNAEEEAMQSSAAVQDSSAAAADDGSNHGHPRSVDLSLASPSYADAHSATDPYAQSSFEDSNDYGGYSTAAQVDHSMVESGYAGEGEESKFAWYSSTPSEQRASGAGSRDDGAVDFSNGSKPAHEADVFTVVDEFPSELHDASEPSTPTAEPAAFAAPASDTPSSVLPPLAPDPLIAQPLVEHTTEAERDDTAELRAALPQLQRAVKDDPQNVNLMVKLARAYMAAEKHALAVIQLQKALKIDERADIYLELGSSYERLGKVDAALRAYTLAEEKAPDSFEVASALLPFLMQRSDWAHAARLVERLLARDLAESDRAQLEIHLDGIYQKMGRGG